MNKEEEKTVISMDMGGAIEPVELPKEEEKTVIELPPTKEIELPQLMQIGPKEDTPPIMENPTEAKVETPPAKPKPRPTPTIGPIPTTPPKPVEEKIEEKVEPKEEVKAEVPTPTVPATPTPAPVAPAVPKAPTLEEIKEEAKKEALAAVKPAPASTPTVPLVPTPAPTTETKQEEVKTVTLPTVEAPTVPETPSVPAPQEEKVEPKEDDLDKTVAIPVEEIKEEVKEEKEPEGPAVIKGPNVIEAPVATTESDKEKEKKKNPYFLECPPNCIPIKPMGYIGYNILYAIPVLGLIFMLAHSASSKNYNRRNHARSKLIAIFLITLLLAGIIYFFNIDVIAIIENATGYKIDIQHFKFTKFK